MFFFKLKKRETEKDASKELAKRKVEFQTFSKKSELVDLITNTDFDVLISNGCPYILPISQIKKAGQIFVNIHPSLLHDLGGSCQVNCAILSESFATAVELKIFL